MFSRILGPTLEADSRKPYVNILFGARQTGKSTLLQQLFPSPDLAIDFSLPLQRLEYGASSPRLLQQLQALREGLRRPPLVIIDEAQLVPSVFDTIQHLYDRDRKAFRFILCGSSARKLRQAGANLLPGRSLLHRLQPLVALEQAPVPPAHPILPPLARKHTTAAVPFPNTALEERLTFGALPGIVTAPPEDRAALLQSYVAIYLEEEIRRETHLRSLDPFTRFLRLAAQESGQIVNYSTIARAVGVSVKTIQAYYDVLEDMFVGTRIQAYSGSLRQGLLSTPRFLFFDLGVRNAAAGLPLNLSLVQANPGPLFEQWVGLELTHRLAYLGQGSLLYCRSKHGFEIDYIVDIQDRLIPLEVKWTERPDAHDCRHLEAFLQAHPERAPHAYVICRTPVPLQLTPRITALPWNAW